jgi:hypothetical protein
MNDTELLCDVAVEAISSARSKGAVMHPCDSWRTEPTLHHVGSALRHIGTDMSQAAGYKRDNEWREHLENAICRLAMALVLEQEAQRG